MVNSITSSVNPLALSQSSTAVPSSGLAFAGAGVTIPMSVTTNPPASTTSTLPTTSTVTPAATSATGTASAGSADTMMPQIINMISMIVTVIANSLGSKAPAKTASTPATTAAVSPTATPATAAAPAAARKPVIAQIDTFSADKTGFNHGQEVAKALSKDTGAGQAQLMQFDLTGKDAVSGINNALSDIIAKVKSGQQVDAVEIPQQAFGDNANAASVRAAIQQLSALGVPVVIAAGNNGKNQKNVLADNSGFVVQNTNNGAVDANSGVGNVNFEGRTTSFASANLAAVVAAKHAQGLNVSQIKQQVGAG